MGPLGALGTNSKSAGGFRRNEGANPKSGQTQQESKMKNEGGRTE
jgi:hypothetical protein